MIGAMSSTVAPPSGVVATADETLAYFVDRSGRTRIPVRRSFLKGGAAAGRPPLSLFVADRRPVALDLFLLLHGIGSAAPWDVRATAMEWARMLDLPATPSSETLVARQWRWLRAGGLVATERTGRGLRVTKLMEDGSGRPYRRPTGVGHGYFQVPFEYFVGRWHKQLQLPGKAALVIALGQAPSFDLPLPRAASWYGLSAATLYRGLVELQDVGLLKVWQRWKKAPNARYGATLINHYALTGPFSRSNTEEVELELAP
jgi:hypothetical protein